MGNPQGAGLPGLSAILENPLITKNARSVQYY
jgi:hypothetical protein